MRLVILDTDAASLLQKRRLPDALSRHVVGAAIAVSFVTVGELHKWAERRSWGPRSRAELGEWLDEVTVIDTDDEVSRIWGGLAARADTRGRPRPVNDTWVAACAIAKSVPLLTLNLRDFEDFETHEGLVLLWSGSDELA